jgi:hypothetical protein
MKKSMLVLAIASAVLALGSVGGSAYAETAQQEKMKTCNADAKAKALKGAERKTFMSSCLSAKGEAAAAPASGHTAQQEKMKTCNADAKTKGLKGAERKTFMSTCLKGSN